MFSPLLALLLAAAPKPATHAVCPVLGGAVDAGSPRIAVRGREYRVCCKGCDVKLLKDPDKYLEPDGTPRNARR